MYVYIYIYIYIYMGSVPRWGDAARCSATSWATCLRHNQSVVRQKGVSPTGPYQTRDACASGFAAGSLGGRHPVVSPARRFGGLTLGVTPNPNPNPVVRQKGVFPTGPYQR